MPKKGRITQKFCESLTPPTNGKDKRIEWDNSIHGFGIACTDKGVKSFILNYYSPTLKDAKDKPRKRRITIGHFPKEMSADKARAFANKLQGIIGEGRDPMQKDEPATGPAAMTVAALLDAYVEKHMRVKRRQSTIESYEKLIDTAIKPHLGNKLITELKRADVEAFHAELKGKKGQDVPFRCNRCVAVLRAAFNKAIDWGYLEKNPAARVEFYPEPRREAWLRGGEMEQLKRALDEMTNQEAADAVRMAILTGCRFGELLQARWKDFDLERGMWTKPAHTVKERKLEHVPLNDAALQLLQHRYAHRPSDDYLFQGKFGAMRNVHAAWVRACRAAGLGKTVMRPVKNKAGKIVMRPKFKPRFRKHDLRHSFCSHLASSGVSLQQIGALVGHSVPTTTQRYAHLLPSSLQQASNVMAGIWNQGQWQGVTEAQERGEERQERPIRGSSGGWGQPRGSTGRPRGL